MIRKDDCSFTVMNENGDIYCEFKDHEKLFIDFILRNYPQFSDFLLNKERNGYDKNFFMKEKYWGTAKCSKDDEYDNTIGEDVAYLKVKKKVSLGFNKRVARLMNKIDREVEDFMWDMNNYHYKREKIFDYIQDCIDERTSNSK